MGFRDIPMPLVSSGVEHGNLRELALARMKDMGTEVRHIIHIYIYTHREDEEWASLVFLNPVLCFLSSVEM